MPSDDVDKLCDEVLRLDAEATAIPWLVKDHPTHPIWGINTEDGEIIIPWNGKRVNVKANFDAIAYYRTAAPTLAREVERLREQVKQLANNFIRYAGHDTSCPSRLYFKPCNCGGDAADTFARTALAHGEGQG